MSRKRELKDTSLCGPLRISAISAFKGVFNAEIAEIRRGRREKHKLAQCLRLLKGGQELWFVFELHPRLTAIENVKTDRRFNAKLLLNQKVSIHLVLVQEETQCWSDRDTRPDGKTQCVLGDIAEPRINRHILTKVYKQEIRLLVQNIFDPRFSTLLRLRRSRGSYG